jgi:hypothetical protein
MNLTARTYAPRAGSVPARVIQFFAANLSDTLSNTDVATKFDCGATSVPTLLKPALEAGFLGKQDGHWCAGDDIDQPPDYGKIAAIDRTVHNAAGLTGAHNPFAAARPVVQATQARAKATRNAAPLPDFSSIKVEGGVQLITTKAARPDVWAPLFDALHTAGLSAVIEPAWRKAVKVQATRRQKAGKGTWVIGIDAAGKTRILRTA